MPLHRTHHLTDRGLCDAVQLGGFREAFGLNQVDKDFEVFHLHGKRFYQNPLQNTRGLPRGLSLIRTSFCVIQRYAKGVLKVKAIASQPVMTGRNLIPDPW